MSEGYTEWSEASPMCPWCGDEITDSPDADIAIGITPSFIECMGCGKMCEVESEIVIRRRARKQQP